MPPVESAEDGPVAAIPAALAALEDLDGRPTAEHVPAFERMHTVLTGALTAIDGV